MWRGKVQGGGYGQFTIGSRTDGSRRLVYAHRFAFEAMVSPIPEGMTIDHLCRVRRCVRPDHLEAVSARENTMRAPTITAAHAAKTVCPVGHPYSGTDGRGKRICATCRKAQRAASKARA